MSRLSLTLELRKLYIDNAAELLRTEIEVSQAEEAYQKQQSGLPKNQRLETLEHQLSGSKKAIEGLTKALEVPGNAHKFESLEKKLLVKSTAYTQLLQAVDEARMQKELLLLQVVLLHVFD